MQTASAEPSSDMPDDNNDNNEPDGYDLAVAFQSSS
jgi:hypothetical protein